MLSKDPQKPAPWTILYADDAVLTEELLPEIQRYFNRWYKALESSRQQSHYHAAPTIKRTLLNRVKESKCLGSLVNIRANTESELAATNGGRSPESSVMQKILSNLRGCL